MFVYALTLASSVGCLCLAVCLLSIVRLFERNNRDKEKKMYNGECIKKKKGEMLLTLSEERGIEIYAKRINSLLFFLSFFVV